MGMPVLHRCISVVPADTTITLDHGGKPTAHVPQRAVCIVECSEEFAIMALDNTV